MTYRMNHLGPIGISAMFYLYVSLEYLTTVTADDGERADIKRLKDVMTVVIWFLVICSIVSFDPLLDDKQLDRSY